LLALTRDDDQVVQEAALGSFLLISQAKEFPGVTPALELEIAQAADAVLENPKTSPRIRGLAEKVVQHARAGISTQALK